MRLRTLVGVWVLLVQASACAHAGPGRAPNLVLLGGNVFTADPRHPWAEALAVEGERIVAVGTTTEIARLAGPTTRRIDLEGRTVVPGFNDAHAHLGAPLPGEAFRTVDDPVPDPSLALLLDSLAAAVRRTPAGSWLHTAIDATLLDDRRARRTLLDSVAPLHPVWLHANTGHGHILNSAALRALAIGDESTDPAGGFYERGDAAFPGRGRGTITGLLHEYAGWNAMRRLRSAQPESLLVAAMQQYGERAVRLGITSVQDIAIAFDAETTLRVHRRAALPLRVRVVPMPASDADGRNVGEWPEAIASEPAPEPGRSFAISGVKWILDGTGIERLSLLRAPYADRPGWSGELNFPPDTLRALLREALAAGEQPILHAIGDGTLAEVLWAMESLAPDSVWRRLRPRLEHAEWLTPDLRARTLRLGAVVVQNPTHFGDPPEMVLARFGEARAREYQPFASLAGAGIPIAIGSDGPMDPFLNLQFAVSHPVNPHEALTVEQAVVAYTRGAAYAEHREHEKGTLAAGMLADFAVLSQNIFEVDPERLTETAVLLTVIGGRIVHDALQHPRAPTVRAPGLTGPAASP
jgi:predicted amidohydrolase YtcJ